MALDKLLDRHVVQGRRIEADNFVHSYFLDLV